MLQETQNDPQEAPRRAANEHPEAPGAENHKNVISKAHNHVKTTCFEGPMLENYSLLKQKVS